MNKFIEWLSKLESCTVDYSERSETFIVLDGDLSDILSKYAVIGYFIEYIKEHKENKEYNVCLNEPDMYLKLKSIIKWLDRHDS